MATAELKPRPKWLVWALFAILLMLAFAMRQMIRQGSLGTVPSRAGTLRPQVEQFTVFGTYGTITFWTAPATAAEASRQIIDALRRLHGTLDIFDPSSELSRLNAQARTAPFACSLRLWRVLGEARHAWAETDGAFDPTVGPLMRLWGFHAKRATLPTQAEVDAALAAVGLHRVVFDDLAHTVQFTHPDAGLDLGGIAKGYALDRAVEIARLHGIRCGLIDLGGNIACLDEPPPGRSAYAVGVRDPFNREALLSTVQVNNVSIATSGNYERTVEIEGRKICHIVDPRTGYPVDGVASVTVVTPSGVDSDVYSTAIFVGGPDLIAKLRQTRRRTSVLRVELDASGRSQAHPMGWIWPLHKD